MANPLNNQVSEGSVRKIEDYDGKLKFCQILKSFPDHKGIYRIGYIDMKKNEIIFTRKSYAREEEFLELNEKEKRIVVTMRL